jgi:hypothetical protein
VPAPAGSFLINRLGAAGVLLEGCASGVVAAAKRANDPLHWGQKGFCPDRGGGSYARPVPWNQTDHADGERISPVVPVLFFFFEKRQQRNYACLLNRWPPNRKRPKLTRRQAFVRVKAGDKNRRLQISANSENPKKFVAG